MSDCKLPFNFEHIPFKYIDQARENKETIDYCPNLRELWRLLLLVGGWGDALNQATLAFLLYEDVETKSHKNTIDKVDKDPVRGRRGMIRLENILGGKRKVTRREAEAFHHALRVGLGNEWANAIDKESLVQLTSSDLFDIMARRNLPWPADLSPAQSLQMLAMLQGSSDLSIEPVFVDTMRAAVVPGHENEGLMTSIDVPIYNAGDAFSLLVDGLNAGSDSYIIAELCFDGVQMPGNDERFEVLPHAIGVADTEVVRLNPGEMGYKVGKASGRFAFVVFAVSSEFDLVAKLPFDLTSGKLSHSEAQDLARLMREAMISGGHMCRAAMHLYQV